MYQQRILNYHEQAAESALSRAAAEFGARVFCKIPLKEALRYQLSYPSNRLSKRDFDFVCRAHLDFVLVRNYMVDFAIDYDGPVHSQDKVRLIDCQKNNICERLELPLFRIDTNGLQCGQAEDVLKKLVAMWYQAPCECTHRGKILTVNKEKLAIVTSVDRYGYLESVSRLAAHKTQTPIGLGRCRVPHETKVCGRHLSELLATIASANWLSQCQDNLRATSLLLPPGVPVAVL